MPVRVKTTDNAVARTWARLDSCESLSSADHLIAVYSLESKDPSFEASAAMEVIQPKSSAVIDSSPSDTGGIETISSASWVKTPWAVCFPPQLQANVQQISERLNLDQHKIEEPSSQPTTPTSSGSRHSHSNLRSQFSVTCGGYDFEQHNDGDATSRVLNIEESEQVSGAALAFSDDDSVSSWTSQNAVKFNKKLKHKTADAHCVKETNNNSNSTPNGSSSAELIVPASFWDASISLLSVDKRDESEVYSGRLAPNLNARDVQENISAGDIGEVCNQVPAQGNPSAKCKKSVRFTNPLVTSQHYRPKTRPEEVSLLFFDEDELEILEEDRETTSRDQFEMIAQELSENRLRISIAYQNRWRDHRRRHSSSSGSNVQVSMSASDA